MLFPWELNPNTTADEDLAQALFVDVTFDILQHGELNSAVRIGALLAVPKNVDSNSNEGPNDNEEKYNYHYVQSEPIAKSHAYLHCKSIDVDITTKPEMVADFLGQALLGGKEWIARICPDKSVGSSSDNKSIRWELKVQHVNQLRGEVGYLPLSCLGASIDRRTLDMILLSSQSRKLCTLSKDEGKRFWKQQGLEMDSIFQSPKVEEQVVLEKYASAAAQQADQSTNESIPEATKERKRPTKTVDSTVYAQSRKTYIAGSKRKKPKFTMGSL